jgi:hypothetical protein
VASLNEIHSNFHGKDGLNLWNVLQIDKYEFCSNVTLVICRFGPVTYSHLTELDVVNYHHRNFHDIRQVDFPGQFKSMITLASAIEGMKSDK